MITAGLNVSGLYGLFTGLVSFNVIRHWQIITALLALGLMALIFWLPLLGLCGDSLKVESDPWWSKLV